MSDFEDDEGPVESHMDSKALRQQAGKRAPSAYNVFVRTKYQERKKSDLPPISFTDYARTVGNLWTNLPDDEKETFRRMSKDQALLPREDPQDSPKVNRRPVSAYNLFVRDSYKKRDETKNIPTTSFNRLVGKMWADLPQAEKDKFAMQARELEAHVKVMLNEGKGDELTAEDRDGGTDPAPTAHDNEFGLTIPTTISTQIRTPVVSVGGVGAMSEYFKTGLNAGTARRHLPMPKSTTATAVARTGTGTDIHKPARATTVAADRVMERLTQQQAFAVPKTWDTASASRPFSKRKYVATRYLRNQCYMEELFDHNLADLANGGGLTPTPEHCAAVLTLLGSQIKTTREDNSELEAVIASRVAAHREQGARFRQAMTEPVPAGKGIDFEADPGATPRAVKRSRTEFKGGRAPVLQHSEHHDIQSLS